MYKFVCNSKFSKTIVAKHISMLTEVNSLYVLHSSRDRFIIPTITELFDIYQSYQCQNIFKQDCLQVEYENQQFMFKKAQILLLRKVYE